MKKLLKLMIFLFVFTFVGLLMVEGQAMARTEIEFWTIDLKAPFGDYFERMISTYEEENSEIEIVWKDFPYAAVQEKLLSSITGGDAPDVVNLSTEMARPLMEKNALTPVNKVDPDYEDTYFEGIWEAGEYEENVFAFPWYLSTQVIMYNEDIFEEAGLDVDDPPETMDEIKEYARQVKENTDKNGFIPQIRLYQDFLKNGIPLFEDEEQTEVGFETKEAVEIVQWYLDLIEEDIVTIEQIRDGYEEAVQRFMSGDLAMLITGPQFLSRVKENAPDVYDNVRVAEMPRGDADIINAAAMNVVIPRTSDHLDEAAEFAHFITGDYAQLEFAKEANVLPSAKEAAEDDYFMSEGDTPEDEARRISARQLEWAEDMTITAPNSNKLIDAIDEEFEKAYYGEITAEQAVKNMAKRWRKNIK
ncbi:MAG: ABC transporter substrate-binding protein [Halanaerobiales bacterium]